jgi:hypothetical protein
MRALTIFFYSQKNMGRGGECKISQCDLPDLELALYDIKINSKVIETCQKNYLLPTIKLRPLTYRVR